MNSLGGVVAATLVSEVAPGGLILESSFSCAKDAAREIIPLLKRFVELRGGHNKGFVLSQPRYERALGEFLQPYPPVSTE